MDVRNVVQAEYIAIKALENGGNNYRAHPREGHQVSPY